MHLLFKTGLLLTALAAASLLPANAGPGVSIFDTGVSATGTTLPNGTMGDPHYTIVSNPPSTTSALFVLTSAYGFPIVPGGWLGDSSSSAWIAPTNTPFLNNHNGGNYDYQTTFNLTGFNPATTSLSGQWAADDFGTDILINGVSTGNATTGGYSAYTPFSITSGFHSGLNTLDFLIVEDGSGGTGLRVDGLIVTAAVPEASTTVSFGLLLILGLGGVLAARRKSIRA